MGDVFLSIRGRVTINVEALNMTESVGNYVKHRRVPTIIKGEGGYAVYFVPSISGESIAHGFQEVLANEAKKNGLPVCELCEKRIFLKSTNENVISTTFLGKNKQKVHEWLEINNDEWNKASNINNKKEKERTKEEKVFLNEFLQNKLPFSMEKAIIKNCVVEDVGGFLYAEKKFNGFDVGGVKRTSNFYTGYLIPTREVINSVVIEPQMHSRYALGTPFVQDKGQMIYYIELSSAIYTFSFDLDTKFIGKTSFVYEKAGTEVVTNRKERLGITMDALYNFLVEFMFGAKKTRILPVIEWESIVIAVSDDVWTVPSSFSNNYIDKAEKKVERVNYNTKLFKYTGGPGFEDTIKQAIEEAKKRVGVI
jgi:CRISPR-associated protein Csa2